MSRPFGDEKFTYSLFLVFCNRILACLIAVVALAVQGASAKPVAPVYSYAAVSVSNVVATFCQYEALKYLIFILQTLGKSAKMIPVMIWGSCLSGKRYKSQDYILAAVVTLGCTGVAVFGSVKAKDSDMTSAAALTYGGLLMLGYLSFDGFTSTFQEKLFKGYQMTIYNQILYVNMFSSLFAIFGLVSAGQAADAINFCIRHTEASVAVFVLSLSAVTAQLCIYYTIRQMGALVYATVMTTRQAISIVGSCIFFGHAINWKQWLGIAMVVGAGYYKAIAKKNAPPKSKGEAPKEAEAKPLLGDDNKA